MKPPPRVLPADLAVRDVRRWGSRPTPWYGTCRGPSFPDPRNDSAGVRLRGGVGVGRAREAVALFEAHHRGPACATRQRIVRRPLLNAEPPERLTPDRICGSAWWVTKP